MLGIEKIDFQRILPGLREIEAQMTDKVQISSNSTKVYCDILGLPDKLRGLTVVDLAAGASSFTSDLLQAGVDVYGLDCSYFCSGIELLIILKEYHQEIVALVNQKEKMSREIRETLEIFWSSYTNESESNRYIPGWLTDLPFTDEFADMTVSLDGLVFVGAESYPLFARSVQEALRITRPGGQLIMSPIYSQVHQQLIEELNRQPNLTVICRSPDNPIYHSEYPTTLEIIKQDKQ